MEESTEVPLTVNNGSTSPSAEESGQQSHINSKDRRRKIIQTIILYIGFFALGLSFSIVGPTLLDLQRNTKTTTETISFVFTARSVIGLGGAVLGGFVTDRLNHWLFLSVAMAIMGPCTILLPYMELFGILVVVFALSGFAGAYFDASGNMVLLKVWGEANGPWMQALHFIFGSGALIGPLIAEPFLTSRTDLEDSSSMNTSITPEESSIVYQDKSGILKVLSNTTMKTIIANVSASEGLVSKNNLTELSIDGDYKSEIHWAYLIVGICAIIASTLLLSISLFCSEIEVSCLNKLKTPKNPKIKKKEEEEDVEDKAFRIQIIVLVFFFYLVYCILEMNYGNYLTVFAVKALHWSEKEGARVTAAYWATFTAGRGIGIILVKLLAPWILITGDIFISALSLFVLLFFSHSHYMVLWACTFGVGFGISTIFATGITWTEQYIRISGAAGAIFMVAAAGGEMVGPILIGGLITSVGPSAFLYVMCGAITMLAILFVVMQLRAGKHGKRKRKKSNAESSSLQGNGTVTDNTQEQSV